MGSPHTCFIRAIIYDDHDYNAATGSCRVLVECRQCQRIDWGRPTQCRFSGDAAKCVAWYRSDGADECPDCGAVDCDKNH